MGQKALHLTWPERYGIDNFIHADCNALAFDVVSHLEKWKTNNLLLHGPEFSGKTHLAHIFKDKHDALLIDTKEGLQSRPIHNVIVIDSIDKLITEHPELSEDLFHLVNAGTLGQKFILMTMRDASSQWVKLPDLLSRLNASQKIEIDEPNETMVKSAYQKLFLDRGLMVEDKVLDYLAIRSERSFAGIRYNIDTLDALSLETARKITIPLIKEANLF